MRYVAQGLLRGALPGAPKVEVEIVFPVSSDAITTGRTARGGAATLPTGLAVVPGPVGGEGCSLEGGCAACPFMKMNTLQALRCGFERLQCLHFGVAED